MPYDRIDRISEEVRKEIDRIIRDDMNDPRIAGTWSIVRADVTRDLKYCKVRVSIFETEKRKDFMAALKSASGFIRRELTHRMSLRYTPELQFVHDRNIAYGVHVASLLRDIAPAQTEESEQNNDL